MSLTFKSLHPTFVAELSPVDLRKISDRDTLEQIRAGLGPTAERCVFWATDITDQEQVKKTFDRVRHELGPVNLLICNAGGGVKRGSFLDITPQDFLRNLHGQAFGPFLCAKEAIPDMLAHGGGSVAYIGATSSVKGYAKSTAFLLDRRRYGADREHGGACPA